MAQVSAWPRALRAAAVGGGTRRELERRGLHAVIAPVVGADSEAPRRPGDAGGRGQAHRHFPRRGRTRASRRNTRASWRDDRIRRLPPPAAARSRTGRRARSTRSRSHPQGLANLFDALDAAFLRARPLFVPHPRVADNARARAAREVVLAGPRTRRCWRRWWHTFAHDRNAAAALASAAPHPHRSGARRGARDAVLAGCAQPYRRHAGRAGAPFARHRERSPRSARGRTPVERGDARGACQVAQLERAWPNRRASRSRSRRCTRSFHATGTNGSSPRSSRCSRSRNNSCSSPATCAPRSSRGSSPRAARAGRPPAFLPIRRALARDIERLKALPVLISPR